jgi:hypothetical protein
MDNQSRIRFFRRQIPEFACIPGCHDCCGPVLASSAEMARLPEVSEAQREKALPNWDCAHLAEHGCSVYEERPLICRMFGTTPRLPCPHGKRPELLIDPSMEKKIELFFRQTRHVLV